MAENLTIDSSSLIKSSNRFAEGMVAFLDTEYEYIQYLRERNGGGAGVGGLGGSTMGGGPEFTDDAPAPKKKTKGIYIPRLRRSKPKRIKPRNRIRIGDKLKNFKLLRRARDVTRQLTKLGLRGNQIEYYKNLRAKNIPWDEALDMAKRSNPGGNFIKNSLKAFRDMIPNRPQFLTRMNMGGNLKHAGNNFFTRGLRPGNFSETFQALKYNVVDTAKTQGDNIVTGAKNLLKPALTKVDDLTKGLVTNADELMKLAMPAFKKFYKVGAGKFIKRIPFGIGALIDFVILTTIFKEDPGRAAFRAAGSTLGAWLGGIAGTAGGAAIGGIGAVIGGPAGAIAGSMLGDWLGGMIFDKTVGKDSTEGTTDVVSEDQNTEKFKEGAVGIMGGADGSVITAPTRGLFGGGRALVGEANEAEIILPMSKIGDAISAVYREGASVMVGATIAFLGPLAGGNPAAAAVLSEARRIGSITGADTDIKPDTVELPDMQTPTEETNSSSSSVELTSSINKETSSSEDNTKVNKSTSVAGTNRWKTILPQGDPLFSSPFGPRWGRMHRGIDIGVWENSPVHAQEDGVVEQILPKFGEYGGAVVISHQDGTANLYGHVYDYNVKKGQKVTKGDMLAKIQYYPGKDGSNQSHLHFERFNKSGTRIDPLPYFSQGGANQTVKETKMKSVNQGGPNLRSISSNFVNLGSQTKQNNQQLIDTPVNITNTSKGTSVQQIPIPSPYPVTVIKKEKVPVEDTMKESRMVIDVFGKGAGRR